ncbi:FMN-dependent NADH-azoreductase [Microbulbifer flavimaris]|uniref:FMN dependent NADH:quinone oxidoreductase n=1 Tax=Microbulbifer flavimaris TaxID=1781068 RepID=A0ABX4I3Y0_9GAMM|nr:MULTISPECIES: FMN-dependent NADH-azoreductase [Microbulbifer]KUJ84787.1 FMN-dependent NADH-azoreductase [Microbulbifer sp. ZGT114]PCO06883.1 FMN-dependent NADH-azoreductase [Microbulbifer flavimaris]
MRKLLQLNSSLFQGGGQSSQLGDAYVERWLQDNPQGQVNRRDLAAEPVPHLNLARFQAFTTPEPERTPEQREVAAYSDRLIAELQEADVIVLGIPMYNFSVPSTLSSYFDHVARAGITFRYTPEGPEGLLANKKAVVFITRGGIYGEDHAQSAYVRQFLGFIGIQDVEIIHAEGLAVGEESKQQALDSAREQIAKVA